MPKKKRNAGELPPDFPPVFVDMNNEVDLYAKEIDDKLIVPITDELVRYENKERIKVLDLSSNKISTLPPKMNRLHKLEVLTLYDNQITELPYWIGELTSLKELWVTGNPLTAFPRELEDCHQLTRIECDTKLEKEKKTILMMAQNWREVEERERNPDAWAARAHQGEGDGGLVSRVKQRVRAKLYDMQDKPVRTPPLTDLEKMHLKYSAKTPFKKGGSFAKIAPAPLVKGAKKELAAVAVEDDIPAEVQVTL